MCSPVETKALGSVLSTETRKVTTNNPELTVRYTVKLLTSSNFKSSHSECTFLSLILLERELFFYITKLERVHALPHFDFEKTISCLIWEVQALIFVCCVRFGGGAAKLCHLCSLWSFELFCRILFGDKKSHYTLPQEKKEKKVWKAWGIT